jgi:hypothetical protein
MNISFPYQHEENEDEKPHRRSLTYEDVLNNLQFIVEDKERKNKEEVERVVVAR